VRTRTVSERAGTDRTLAGAIRQVHSQSVDEPAPVIDVLSMASGGPLSNDACSATSFSGTTRLVAGVLVSGVKLLGLRHQGGLHYLTLTCRHVLPLNLHQHFV